MGVTTIIKGVTTIMKGITTSRTHKKLVEQTTILMMVICRSLLSQFYIEDESRRPP